MRRLKCSICTSLLCLLLVSVAQAQQQGKHSPSGRRPAPASASRQPKAIKVLVRVTELSEVALDGAKFIDALEETLKRLKAGNLEHVQLQSGRGLVVVQESQRVVGLSLRPDAASNLQWKTDPAGFDFLVNWTIHYVEDNKNFLSSPLYIRVKETLESMAISDPTQKRTWSTRYFFNAPQGLIEVEAHRGVSDVLTARAPIMRDIRNFLTSRTVAPVKVLVRIIERAELPPERARILDELDSKVEKAKPEELQEIRLASGLGIEVKEERRGRVPALSVHQGKDAAWGIDPVGFDFLVNWTIDYTDTKQQYFDKINAKWTLEATSVSNPTVKRTWTGSDGLSENSSHLSMRTTLQELRFFILFPQE